MVTQQGICKEDDKIMYFRQIKHCLKALSSLPLHRMKKVISFFLLLLIMSQVFVRVGVYLSWKMNQAYLMKYECVNRNKPGSCCQAKCQLNKRFAVLDSESKKDQEYPPKMKFAEQESFIITVPYISDFGGIADEQKGLYKIYPNLYRFSPSRFLFHPPSAIV
jgi:hypothetical protein